MSTFVILLTVIVGALFIFYKRWARIYNYWAERGMVHRKPYPFFGNMIENVLRKRTVGEVLHEMAMEFKDHRYIGVYNYLTPDLMLTNVDDVQTVMIKAFSHFMDRGPEIDTSRPLNKHLFNLTGAKWKGVRNKVSPAFSSGKLKGMFPLMIKSYENISKYIDSIIDVNNATDVDPVLEMYITSVAASSIYGIDPEKLASPQSEFKRHLDKFNKTTLRSFLAVTMITIMPRLAAIFNVSFVPNEQAKYLESLVLDTFKERVKSGIVRDDIVQMLLQLKQTGRIEVNQWVKEDEEELGSEPSSVTETIEITDEILVAHGFIFLIAGFDPLKTAMSLLLLELCKNKEILERLKTETEGLVGKHGEVNWQVIKENEYLDWCLSETMRLYPPLDFLARQCVKEFTFPDGQTVEKGTRVLIPVLNMNMNPTLYPEPEKFKPERFAQLPVPNAYMPFGTGPRMCIARRLAIQEIKLFIVKLIMDYEISLDPRTELPVKNDKWFFLRRVQSKIYIKFQKKIK